MKNNIDYYQHFADSHQHPKFKMLRIKYGWEGEGKFWALNNMIANSEECWLDLSRKFILADLLELFQIQADEFLEFIEYLVSECELLIRDNDKITTSIIQEILETTNRKRKRERSRYDKNNSADDLPTENNILPAEKAILPTDETQTKLKETKPKEKKEEVLQNKFKHPGKGEIPVFHQELTNIDFTNQYQVSEEIKILYGIYANKGDPEFVPDIEPVLKLLNNSQKGLSTANRWEIVVESFIALNQSEKKHTGYLLGIMRQKLNQKYAEVQKQQQKQLVEIENKSRRNDLKKQKELSLTETKKLLKRHSDKLSQDEYLKIDLLIKEEKHLSALSALQPYLHPN